MACTSTVWAVSSPCTRIADSQWSCVGIKADSGRAEEERGRRMAQRWEKMDLECGRIPSTIVSKGKRYLQSASDRASDL